MEEGKERTSGYDTVNHPPYYCGKIEVIDFIEDRGFNFNRGQVCRYLSRAGKKDPSRELEDLRKAEFYLKREIQTLQDANDNK